MLTTFRTTILELCYNLKIMKEIAMALMKCKMDVVALLRWKDFGEIRKRKYILFYSGKENKAGFWMNMRMKNKFREFQ